MTPTRDSIVEAIAAWSTLTWAEAEAALRAYEQTRGRAIMGEPGQDTGLRDVCGKMVCVGDTLEFDEREWGGPCTFEVGWREGELVLCGTTTDVEQWCTVVKRWGE